MRNAVFKLYKDANFFRLVDACESLKNVIMSFESTDKLKNKLLQLPIPTQFLLEYHCVPVAGFMCFSHRVQTTAKNRKAFFKQLN